MEIDHHIATPSEVKKVMKDKGMTNYTIFIRTPLSSSSIHAYFHGDNVMTTTVETIVNFVNNYNKNQQPK